MEIQKSKSPPSRGAWIEMMGLCLCSLTRRSRPPRGGRGLKYIILYECRGKEGLPPRGGRGLKYQEVPLLAGNCSSPPSRGAWIEMS